MKNHKGRGKLRPFQFPSTMSKKLKLSEATKHNVKRSFDLLDPAKLSGDKLRYYKMIENGKRTAAKAVRFEGKFLSGQIVNTIDAVAQRKGISREAYMREHETAISRLIESGYTQTDKSADKAIDAIAGYKRKTIVVETTSGKVRMSKEEAIKRITELQQYAASNTTVVAMSIPVRVYTNNSITVSFPMIDDYELMTEDDFDSLLDDEGIWSVKSSKGE